MDELAALAINAHGGLARRRHFAQLTGHQTLHCYLCQQMGEESAFEDVALMVALHHQWTRIEPIGGRSSRATATAREADPGFGLLHLYTVQVPNARAANRVRAPA